MAAAVKGLNVLSEIQFKLINVSNCSYLQMKKVTVVSETGTKYFMFHTVAQWSKCPSVPDHETRACSSPHGGILARL